MEIVISRSEEETIKVGEEFGRQLKNGSVVALYGDLGAGKTQFVKGVCQALKVTGVVNSPTFTIVNEYHGATSACGEKPSADMPVYHIDLYRMKDVDEILGIGFDEYLESGGVCLVEWAEKLDGILPEKRFDVKITVVDDTTREIAMIQMNNDD